MFWRWIRVTRSELRSPVLLFSDMRERKIQGILDVGLRYAG